MINGDKHTSQLLQICTQRRLIIEKIKNWLIKEMNDNTEGYTRQECATKLYECIKDWESKCDE